MERALKKEIRKYKREIRGCLLASTKLSRRYLADISQTIDLFVEEQGVTSFPVVQAHFGTPEEIAKAFFAETDLSYLRKLISIKRVIAALLIAVFSVWFGSILFSAIESHLDPGYGIESGVYDIHNYIEVEEETT